MDSRKRMKESNTTLSVKNLAQIREGTVEFGDFTLVIGPQASGKSIFLQLLKLIIDRHNISETLRINGFNLGKRGSSFLELFFGEQMSGIWTEDTEVNFDGKAISQSFFLPKQGVREEAREEKLFYVPAQRVVTMHQGWPRSFGSFDIGDPYVLKSFSETVRISMERESAGGRKEQTVFPKPRKIKEPLRQMINSSIFYDASVELDTKTIKKRFLLHIEKSMLPFMSWSAGQKEFMPLLLSYYHLMPSARIAKKDYIKWVVIEEPEMGLHPKAIQSVLVICLDLLERGYKVVISTHSPALLELAWTMNYVKNHNGTSKDLFELFSLINNQSLQRIFDTVIGEKTFKTYYFQRKFRGVYIKDISSLDTGSEDKSVANWGGLSEFASKASDIVSKLVANEESEKEAR